MVTCHVITLRIRRCLLQAAYYNVIETEEGGMPRHRAAYQACVGPDDEQPVGVVITHGGSQANPHPKQQHTEDQAPDRSHEKRVAVHTDMGAKVGVEPAAHARLALGGLNKLKVRIVLHRPDMLINLQCHVASCKSPRKTVVVLQEVC